MGWVQESRKNLRTIVGRLPRDFQGAVRDTAIDVLCDELRKIPVPIVSTLLANTARRALKAKSGGPGIEVVLATLKEMQQSDDDFLRGLGEMGEDIDRLDETIREIVGRMEAARREQTEPRPIMSHARYLENYPISDNELRFILMNIGGGAVTVPEIELVAESWEPETEVDYSVPAAPLLVLRLKARLSPGTPHYPLLKLNDEPPRRFGAYSEGAEEVCVQMSSDANARYRVRIQVPYRDAATAAEGRLIYPLPDTEAQEVSFPYAPGWNPDVTPEKVLGRDAIVSDIVATFSEVAGVLADGAPSDEPERSAHLDQRVMAAGFPMGVYPEVLAAFAVPTARMAEIEKRHDALPAILGLAHQLMRYSRHEPPFEKLRADELARVSGKPELAGDIRQLFTELEEGARKRLLSKLLEALR